MFHFFCRDVSEVIKKEGRVFTTLKEMAVETTKRWQAISAEEKAKYAVLAAADKERYAKERDEQGQQEDSVYDKKRKTRSRATVMGWLKQRSNAVGMRQAKRDAELARDFPSIHEMMNGKGEESGPEEAETETKESSKPQEMKVKAVISVDALRKLAQETHAEMEKQWVAKWEEQKQAKAAALYSKYETCIDEFNVLASAAIVAHVELGNSLNSLVRVEWNVRNHASLSWRVNGEEFIGVDAWFGKWNREFVVDTTDSSRLVHITLACQL